MATAKLIDYQVVEVTIANGQLTGQEIVTHNLQDQNGNDLTPDTVNCEILELDCNDTYPYVNCVQVTRSAPEDGTFVLTVHGDFTPNFTGDTVVYLGVTSYYTHSVQGADHTA